MTTVCIDLPFPPSVNSLFFNKTGRGRIKTDRYKTWRNAAGWDLKAQKAKQISGPYELHLTFEDGKSRCDLDNLAKAIIDLLVEHQITDDDKNARKITLEWGNVSGCRCVVREAVSQARAAA